MRVQTQPVVAEQIQVQNPDRWSGQKNPLVRLWGLWVFLLSNFLIPEPG